jgi:hypothetical protein
VDHWIPIIGPFVGLLATAVGGWIAKHLGAIADAKQHETALQRATVLEKIAEGAAALAVSLYPTAPWATLLKQVVSMIASAAGLPTTNASAIERAAAAALTKLGKLPAATPAP